MKLEPGCRAVVAFPRPCCGSKKHCGQQVVVERLATLAEAARTFVGGTTVPIVQCAMCNKFMSPDIKLAFVQTSTGMAWLHACRLVPLPPDDKADDMFYGDESAREVNELVHAAMQQD